MQNNQTGLTEQKVNSNSNMFKFRLKRLEDVNGSPYLGLTVDQIDNISFSDSYLLKNKLCTQQDILNKHKRDGGEYHITVFNVSECSRNSNLFNLVGTEICDLKLFGIGKITKENDYTYYIVCSSIQVNMLRDFQHFPQKHLHITLAFSNKDLHHLPKNRNTIIYEF